MNSVPRALGSRYYRDQLSEQGRLIYDTLCQAFREEDFSGQYQLFFPDPPHAFTDAFAAHRALFRDRPEFFFLGRSCRVTRSGDHGVLHCPILYGPSEIVRLLHHLRRLLHRLTGDLTALPPIRRELVIYRRIAQHLTYMDRQDDADHSIVAPLLFSTGVCEGYTALLLLCLRQLGLPCIKVLGYGRKEPHCWSIVWIDGSPVHCDVTWDSGTAIVPYHYFNLSDRQMKAAGHSRFQSPQLPPCPREDLNLFHLIRCSFSNGASLQRHILHALDTSPSAPIYIQAPFVSSQQALLCLIRKILTHSQDCRTYHVSIAPALKAAVITPVPKEV